VSNFHTAKKNGPVSGAIRLAASLKSHVVVMIVVVMVVMMRLCAWNRANRERNGGDGGHDESKLPHKKFSSGWIFKYPKDGESVCSRQTDIYEWSFRKPDSPLIAMILPHVLF
jgi:hypothetical protein